MIQKYIVLYLLISSCLNLEYLTTNNGAPVDNYRNSLTVGKRGPTLL